MANAWRASMGTLAGAAALRMCVRGCPVGMRASERVRAHRASIRTNQRGRRGGGSLWQLRVGVAITKQKGEARLKEACTDHARGRMWAAERARGQKSARVGSRASEWAAERAKAARGGERGLAAVAVRAHLSRRAVGSLRRRSDSRESRAGSVLCRGPAPGGELCAVTAPKPAREAMRAARLWANACARRASPTGVTCMWERRVSAELPPGVAPSPPSPPSMPAGALLLRLPNRDGEYPLGDVRHPPARPCDHTGSERRQ